MAKIVLVFPVGSVENERIFSTMNIVKDELRNCLGENQLNVCVRMFRSHHNHKSFPVREAMKKFLVAKKRSNTTV